MRKLTVVLFIAAAFAVACGSTPITVGGKTLQPASSDMLQFLGIPYVIVSDVPDYCSKLKASYSAIDCNTSSSSGNNPFGSVAGSYLAIIAIGASDGAKLDVLDGGFGFTATRGAVGSFYSFGTASTSFATTAVSGSVQVGSFRSAQSINGDYDFTFANGEKKNGHFAATYCDAYDLIVANASKMRSCSYSAGSGTCSRDCSCNSQQVSADCTQVVGTATWNCSCRDPNGATSTCQMTNADCFTDTGTCCPLRF